MLDTRGALRCVRFESGDVGVVDKQGKVILQYGKFRRAEFADHDFVKLKSRKVEVLQNPKLRNMLRDENCSCSHVFYVDLKSGQMYGSMPDLHKYGDFEVCFLRAYMFTRTKQCYSVDTDPSFVRSAKNGLFLQIPYNGTPENDICRKMLYRHRLYYKCQIKGDEAKVYWLIVQSNDESVVVMDDEEAAERQRRKDMKSLESVVPFQIGGKWGLKLDGRIIVPPIYHTIQAPVGKYCAMETYPGIWGVIAIDGKIEVEAKYDGVEVRPDGTVELTVFNGKTVIKKLKN